MKKNNKQTNPISINDVSVSFNKWLKKNITNHRYTSKEEYELTQTREGFQKLCASFYAMVHLVAFEYSKKIKNKSIISHEDLFQEAMLFTCRQQKNYNPDKGARFQSYIVWWWRSAMQKLYRKQWIVMVPDSGNSEYKHDIVYCPKCGTRWSTNKDRADLFGLFFEKPKQYTQCPGCYNTLLAKKLHIHCYQSSDKIDTYFAQKTFPQNLEKYIHDKQSQKLWSYIDQLNPKEKDIITKYYKYNYTLEEISIIYNCTKERIRQIKEQALKKLKDAIPIEEVQFE